MQTVNNELCLVVIYIDFKVVIHLSIREKTTMKYLKKFALMTVLWLSASTAFAAMVATPELTAEPERAQLVRNIAERQHVTQQLIELGVEPADAIKRVNQMTDQQISSLQGQITGLPAGAGISTTNLLLIIIVLILLI